MKNKTYFKLNLIYFTALVLVAVLFILGHFQILTNEWISSLLIQVIVMTAIPLLMYTLLVSKNFKKTLNDIGFKKISIKTLLIVIVLGFILYFLNSYIATFFSSIISMLGYERLTTTSQSINTNYTIILQEFILTAILPGICEEILHRGIMLHSAKKVNNTHTCLLISSLLFGLTHLNINQVFYAAILGYLMGYVNLITDSIFPSIIIHFMNNFLNIYFVYGRILNWPFANLVYNIETFLASNILIFISSSTVAVLTLILLYKYFTSLLTRERSRYELKNTIKLLRQNKLSLIEAKIKINQANQNFKNQSKLFENNNKETPSFVDNIFLISAFTLGVLVTIFSFIWGIL